MRQTLVTLILAALTIGPTAPAAVSTPAADLHRPVFLCTLMPKLIHCRH